MQQVDTAGSSSSSIVGPVAKVSGQQHQICVNQGQSGSSVATKTTTSTVVSVASLVTTPASGSGKAAVSGNAFPACLLLLKLRFGSELLQIPSIANSRIQSTFVCEHLPEINSRFRKFFRFIKTYLPKKNF